MPPVTSSLCWLPIASPAILDQFCTPTVEIWPVDIELESCLAIGLFSEQQYLAEDLRYLLARQLRTGGDKRPVEQPIGSAWRRLLSFCKHARVDFRRVRLLVRCKPPLQLVDIVDGKRHEHGVDRSFGLILIE